MKKVLSILLAALMLSTTFSACGNEAVDSVLETSDKATDTQTEAVTTEDPFKHDNLPADLNLNGQTVSFLYREEIAGEFYAGEQNGEVVNDALFNSHADVEKRLNADIKTILLPGHLGPVRQSYMDNISNSVAAEDYLYDWVDLMVGNTPGMMVKGLFADIAQNKYMDLDQPWYMANIMEQVAIDGKLYCVAGDASIGYLQTIYCLYFNKQIAENHNVGNLYSIVQEGKWTLDKLMEVSAKTYVDLNGDGKKGSGRQLGVCRA